jgi:hypothetical protein
MQAAAAPVFTELIAGADVTIGETVMATGPWQMTWQIPDPPAEDRRHVRAAARW